MMREKLIELIKVRIDNKTWCVSDLADYLIANGVIVPPCKIADRIYQTDGIRIYTSSIHEITYTASKTIYVTESIVFDETAIGKSVFFNREDAERALKGVTDKYVGDKAELLG